MFPPTFGAALAGAFSSSESLESSLLLDAALPAAALAAPAAALAGAALAGPAEALAGPALAGPLLATKM